MKELEYYKNDSNEVKKVAPIKKEKELLGTLYPQKGHKCFEINTLTNEIKEAEYSTNETAYLLNPGVSVKSMQGYIKRVLNTKSDCVYITALNKKNALKKYREQLKTKSCS
jgi:hypothetical protein